MDLASLYAHTHRRLVPGWGADGKPLRSSAFFEDLTLLQGFGMVETVVRPCGGWRPRKAVYALCLRVDAIPHQLPADLAAKLRVHDLPEPVDDAADSLRGRLSVAVAPAWSSPTRRLLPYLDAAQLAAAPRWLLPAGSRAALAAASIAEAGKTDLLGRPRCAGQLDDMIAHHQTGNVSIDLSRSLSTSGLSGAVSSDPGPILDGRARRTPPRAAKSAPGRAEHAAARRLLTDCWHAWRAKLGRGHVILPAAPDQDGHEAQGGPCSLTGHAYDDLRRLMALALMRATYRELLELLTTGIPDDVRHVGRLAAGKLWRVVRRRHTYAHRTIRKVPLAGHVVDEDTRVMLGISPTPPARPRRTKPLSRTAGAALAEAREHARQALDAADQQRLIPRQQATRETTPTWYDRVGPITPIPATENGRAAARTDPSEALARARARARREQGSRERR